MLFCAAFLEQELLAFTISTSSIDAHSLTLLPSILRPNTLLGITLYCHTVRAFVRSDDACFLIGRFGEKSQFMISPCQTTSNKRTRLCKPDKCVQALCLYIAIMAVLYFLALLFDFETFNYYSTRITFSSCFCNDLCKSMERFPFFYFALMETHWLGKILFSRTSSYLAYKTD